MYNTLEEALFVKLMWNNVAHNIIEHFYILNHSTVKMWVRNTYLDSMSFILFEFIPMVCNSNSMFDDNSMKYIPFLIDIRYFKPFCQSLHAVDYKAEKH